MFRRLYDKTMQLSEKRGAMWVLAGVSFLESSIFPIPPDLFLIPFALAQRQKAFHLALVCTIASVIGGLAGYAIGALFYETVGQWIIELYHQQEAFAGLSDSYEKWGFWIVFAAGMTPFPYKVITIASGLFMMNLPMFIIGSILGRGIRFFAVAALIYYFGEPIRTQLERHFNLFITAFFILLLGGFLVIAYI